MMPNHVIAVECHDKIADNAVLVNKLALLIIIAVLLLAVGVLVLYLVVAWPIVLLAQIIKVAAMLLVVFSGLCLLGYQYWITRSVKKTDQPTIISSQQQELESSKACDVMLQIDSCIKSANNEILQYEQNSLLPCPLKTVAEGEDTATSTYLAELKNETIETKVAIANAEMAISEMAISLNCNSEAEAQQAVNAVQQMLAGLHKKLLPGGNEVQLDQPSVAPASLNNQLAAAKTLLTELETKVIAITNDCTATEPGSPKLAI